MAKASFYRPKSNSSKENGKAETTGTVVEESTAKASAVSGADSMVAQSSSTEEQWFFRRALWLILGSLLVLVAAFTIGFFASLRGAEKTVIPNLERMELVDAMISLQEKGLIPQVQVKYTQSNEDKGLVISQTPSAGQSVKAGRRVTMVVSQGNVVKEIGEYKGKTLDELKLELQTVFASFQAQIQIGEVIYQYSQEPEGTIIAQEPEPGTMITGLTKMNLIVSRGLEDGSYKIENVTGIKFTDAMAQLMEQNIPFLFHIDSEAPEQSESIVFRQVPAIGEMAAKGTVMELYINPFSQRYLNNAGDNMVFDVFEYQLPQYMVPVNMRLERTVGATDPEVIFEMKHPGGPISIPYLEEQGTLLVLYVNDKKLISYHVP